VDGLHPKVFEKALNALGQCSFYVSLCLSGVFEGGSILTAVPGRVHRRAR
jgi:hypothetical protein